MKMVKSLLLGSAAGLVAMTGAQAADLPVKARPVQYVKICSLYGAGFYYVPGTDMCLKIGGYVREQIGYGVNGSLTIGGLVANVNTRGTQNFAERARGYITADARNQTEWGTVRSYIAVGLSAGSASAGTGVVGDPASGAVSFSANRAFIQFAGFTFGITQSFYDFYSAPATSFFGGNINPSSDTGDAGKQVTAYTAQFGSGLSATISAEGQRNAGVINSAIAPTAIAAPASDQVGENWPDIIANLRIDQAWGSAQIMGALHDASGQYYGAVPTTSTGNPTSKAGWALGAGIKLNAPMIGPGDYFQAQVNYSEGASEYENAVGGYYSVFNGQGLGGTYGLGVTSDSVYGTLAGANQAIQLTTSWGANAAYEHFWNKSWQTSVYGAYNATKYNATANTLLCTDEAAVFVGLATATCNNNWNMWAIGSRTQWNVDSQTSMGVDIVYQHLDTALAGETATFGTGTQPAVLRSFASQGDWMGQFRIHRNFYP